MEAVSWATILLCGLGGAVAGLLYFGTLRATVERVPTSSRPGSLLLASTLVRMAGAMAAFFWVARTGGFVGLVASLAGFAASRALFLRRARTP